LKKNRRENDKNETRCDIFIKTGTNDTIP